MFSIFKAKRITLIYRWQVDTLLQKIKSQEQPVIRIPKVFVYIDKNRNPCYSKK